MYVPPNFCNFALPFYACQHIALCFQVLLCMHLFSLQEKVLCTDWPYHLRSSILLIIMWKWLWVFPPYSEVYASLEKDEFDCVCLAQESRTFMTTLESELFYFVPCPFWCVFWATPVRVNLSPPFLDHLSFPTLPPKIQEKPTQLHVGMHAGIPSIGRMQVRFVEAILSHTVKSWRDRSTENTDYPLSLI